MSAGNGDTTTPNLCIVANRLPVTIQSRSNGEVSVERSSGGPATALASTHAERGRSWIGWPGVYEDNPVVQRRIEASLRDDYRCIPVFLSSQDIQKYYEGFSNNALWPLFHYFPTYVAYDEEEWESYVEVNRHFCDVVLTEVQEHDLIWIHDYHLFLLPEMLRQHLPEAHIGFFLHIPFPASEMFRILPCREALLQGLLGADLVGFQTFNYMQNFLSSVYRLLGIEAKDGRLAYGGRPVGVGVHPIGIKPQPFLDAIHRDPHTAKSLQQLDVSLGSCKLVLGMDRLDYSKGIPARLRAYQRFLESHAEWRERVTLIQVAVPSRERVMAYQDLKRQVDKLVGEINGSYGTTTWTPVQYFHRNLPFSQICALLRRADVALVTPLCDGMNLVAKEYVACQEHRPGALMISEFAGASSTLAEAFFVNPYDIEGMAERLHEVLCTPEEVLVERMSKLSERVGKYTVDFWAETFLGALEHMQLSPHSRPLTGHDRQRLLAVAAQAERRLVLLSYDGVLAPLIPFHQRAAPTSEVLSTLRDLQLDPRNTVAIVSSRDRAILHRWLSGSECLLAAEHGAWLYRDNTWHALQDLQNEWKFHVKPIMERFVEITPGSSLEEKDYSLVWHYRMAEPEFSLWQARELVAELEGVLANSGLHVQNGHKVVEVKWTRVHKGLAATSIMEHMQPLDFILAIGDDRTDEDLFQAVPPEQWTVKVGIGVSTAQFFLPQSTDVIQLLQRLTTVS